GGGVVGHVDFSGFLGGGDRRQGTRVGGLRVVAVGVDGEGRGSDAAARALVPLAILRGLALANALELLAGRDHDFPRGGAPPTNAQAGRAIWRRGGAESTGAAAAAWTRRVLPWVR